MQRVPAVLFGLVSGAVGGGQRVALAVARAVKASGGRVAAVAPDDGPSLESFRALDAPVHVTGPLRSYDARALVDLTRIVRAVGVTCVYTHSVPVHEVLLVFAARLAGARAVVHRHILGQFRPSPLRAGWQRLLWRRALRMADEVVCVSSEVALQARALGRRQCRIVPNGVALPAIDEPREAREPLVGYVGRLDVNKRPQDFVRAAALVRARCPEARFVVVGGAPSGDDADLRCRDLAEQLGLGDRMCFTGPLPDATAVLRALDVLVLPSALEGHPLVLLEAMALGKAVVATDIPACRGVVTDGVDGRLVPVAQPDAIAEAVIGLLQSPEARAHLGAAARARVEREFTEERMIERLLPLVLS